MVLNKLDGVGPVDNRPSADKLHRFVRKKERRKWHVICDMWHVTHDTWHVTCDTWHVTRDKFGGGWTSSQNFSSLTLTVCDSWYYEDLEEKDESLNDEAVYRTAPATPGLFNIIHFVCSSQHKYILNAPPVQNILGNSLSRSTSVEDHFWCGKVFRTIL